MQCLSTCVQRFLNAIANKTRKYIHSLCSVGQDRPRKPRSACTQGVTLVALADLRHCKSSYREKMPKHIRGLSEKRPGPAGVQRFSRCLKAQPRRSPQSSYWAWQGMAITGYVHFWCKTFLFRTTFDARSSCLTVRVFALKMGC